MRIFGYSVIVFISKIKLINCVNIGRIELTFLLNKNFSLILFKNKNLYVIITLEDYMLPPEMMMYANSAETAGRMYDELMQEEMKKQQFLNNSNKQVEILQQQINVLNQQLDEVKSENKKLDELCELKTKELEDLKKDLKRNRI